MPRALLCMNPFKGTLSAQAATAAVARGLRRCAWSVDALAAADGGPGTLAALRASRGGTLRRARVRGPLGAEVRAAWLSLGPQEAVVESAQAMGLELCPPGKRDALAASSRGLGELLLRAYACGARRIWLGLGGSASTDGGSGMARALGWRFVDVQGRDLPEGGGSLAGLARVLPPAAPPLKGLDLRALCDVENPLFGPKGAAAVYAPQKGAGPPQVRRLDLGLKRLAKCLPLHEPNLAGAGAAGGLGYGVLAFARGRLVPGAETLLDLAGFSARLAKADWVLSGEGRLDAQTLRGKLPAVVARLAASRGLPCALFCGASELSEAALGKAGVRAVLAAPGRGPRSAAFALERAAEAWGLSFRPKPPMETAGEIP